MYGLSRLHMLHEMNLSNNGIITIEGLKDLVHLRHLDLHGNNIKTVEHLNSNVQLEYLNLSENSIGTISDISMLKNLKVCMTIKKTRVNRTNELYAIFKFKKRKHINNNFKRKRLRDGERT